MSHDAPVIPPQESIALDFNEALGLNPPLARRDRVSLFPPREAAARPRSSSAAAPFVLRQPLDAPDRPSSSSASTARPSSASTTRSRPPVGHRRDGNMATCGKAQAQCFELCHKIAAAGDAVAERMAEYSSIVKHPPFGFDGLANELLDVCHILFYIEAGLDEAVDNVHPLPLEMITVLERRFRAAQADFKVLDHTVGKWLDNERRGAVGRMRRGLGKVFGKDGIDKMLVSLQRHRAELKMSALMFQWNLGSTRIESDPGIGYISLNSTLEDSNLRRKHESLAFVTADDRASSSSSIYRSKPGSRQRKTDSMLHEPMTQPPGTRDSRNIPFSPDSTSGESALASEFGQGTPATRYTASSSSSHDRPDGLDEVPELSTELAALVADVVGPGLDTLTVDRRQADVSAMPRRRPRSNTEGDKVSSKHALVDAIRTKDHRLVSQLLDRGVSPNTGPDAHAVNESIQTQDHALVDAIRTKDHRLVSQLLDRGVSPNTGPDAHAVNESIQTQDVESLRLLLLYGADPDALDREGLSPLGAAARCSQLCAAALLLKYGADAGMEPPLEMERPLAVAAAANNVRLARLLLMYGGDPNQPTAEGDTVLISCIGKKTPKRLVETLLAHGADPNDKNRDGKTALFDAIQSARVDIVSLLLEKGADPNLPGPKHMLWPATYQPPCVEVLLAHGADHKKCPGIMELATSINRVESVQMLLKAGVDPNAKKDGVYTPLCTSIRDNRGDIFQLLLANGADPNLRASEYPAFKCVTHHREHFLPALVAAGARLNTPKGILETAVSSNNGQALGWLLDQGLDPDEKNGKGYTALTSAVRDDREGFVELLLARGANPNVRGQDWPVCIAVRHPAILKRILETLPEPRAFKGVVEMAVVANQLDSIKLLLAAGVSVEDRNGGVFSPLTTALRERRREIVSYLINEGGADVNAPGEHLPIVKALRRCQDEEHADMIDMLLDKGADPNKMYRGWNGIMQALENGDAAMLARVCSRSGVDVDVKDELGRNVTEIAVSRRWEEAVNILLANATTTKKPEGVN
ncbi:hypothetical protein L249_4451 [Ophiocordyceps polyrhachis-furcata BCC 54312]|uniref:Uncharacterized protein n=1 Tax=Ophiocordyceps polyrhachis-furcata BCC 54312 TaxID=1330021 RepID=A0A367L7U8_9HYPO|nr:hypothetical protein L249_4451 [Ophiocordyceps polyrhachis-furcata BCC 54312]